MSTTMTTTITPTSAITVSPINPSKPNFGAVLGNVNVEKLNDADFAVIYDALYRYNVICIKSYSKLPPSVQAELTRRFDPAAKSYGHGKTIDAKRSILHPDLKTIPCQPEVQVIGNGHIDSYEGLTNIQLKHPHHRTFHETVIPDDKDHDYTRFYRWHIDAALYGALHPPRVTSLLAVQLAPRRMQTLLYDDGSNEELQVPLGTTAFVDGYEMFDILSAEDKEFAMTSSVEYNAHPYVWISTAKSRSDGLGMVSRGEEVPNDQLPSINTDDIQILPMCWKNPVTGKFALQIHPSPVRRIHTTVKDGSVTVMEDLEQVRETIHRLQRQGIAPERVYAHDWSEGDLVLFNNHGVLHSVVGAFGKEEIRLFRQCNLAASAPPVGPDMRATIAA